MPPGVRLARALESLGPAAIKLGQILATRPDVIGADVAHALESLQDRLPPFATDVAKAEIEAALGRPLDEMFAVFGDAVAAASIAQVHRAETAEETPRLVAVKVLRPGIEGEFARDLSAFAFAARMAERVSAEARRLRLIALVDTLADIGGARTRSADGSRRRFGAGRAHRAATKISAYRRSTGRALPPAS